MTKPSSPVVAVIGAGLAGAATAWRLSTRGIEVVVLERTVPANPWGSSHGSARIFRYAYPDPFYVDLVARAREAWAELEEAAGCSLLTRTGSLDFGSGRDPAALAASLDTVGIAHEVVDVAQARVRWPGIRFDTPALFHDAAGVLDAEQAVQQMLRLAQLAGARVRTGWSVTRLHRESGAIRLVSEHGEEVRADRVVVAAGAWLPDLVAGLGLSASQLAALPALEVWQEQAAHFPFRDPTTAWPTFIHKRPDIQVYGLPGGRDAGFKGLKVAQFHGGHVIASARAHDRIVDPAARARIVDYVRESLPGLVPEPYAEATCLFTATPNEDFVIDSVGDLAIVSPCSGHGAKFAPLTGELAARLLTGDGALPARFRPLAGLVSA